MKKDNPRIIITTPELEEARELHVTHYAEREVDRIIDHSIEEMAELIQALMKYRHSKEDQVKMVKEELADTLFCLECLTRNLHISRREIKDNITYKAKRFVKRVEEGNVY